jgi:hypothetical protein
MVSHQPRALAFRERCWRVLIGKRGLDCSSKRGLWKLYIQVLAPWSSVGKSHVIWQLTEGDKYSSFRKSTDLLRKDVYYDCCGSLGE